MNTLDDIECRDKRVLMRVDFNVPLKEGCIANSERIKAALPSIRFVLENNGSLTLMSHLGKPQKEFQKSSADDVRKKLSLKVVILELAKCLNISEDDIAFVDDYYDGNYSRSHIPDKKIVLLENLRFDKREESKDEGERQAFAKVLKEFGDVYVNDAFGTAHRPHASVYDVPLSMECAAGFLMQKEIEKLSYLLKDPERPFVVVLGGAKVADKVNVIRNLKADEFVIIGAMKYAFDAARGRNVGKSLCEGVDVAKELIDSEVMSRIYVAEDDVIAKKSEAGFDYASARVADGLEPIGADELGLDIGPKTIEAISKIVAKAKTLVWNGPAGFFEDEHFSKGTYAIANMLASLKGVKVFIGGGDSVSAIASSGHAYDEYYHVSTGGGATLEMLEGKVLPAIRALG